MDGKEEDGLRRAQGPHDVRTVLSCPRAGKVWEVPYLALYLFVLAF